jgi:hypothetical protein
VYLFERLDLEQLLQHVPEQLVYKAYFENYNADPESEDKVPAWKELVQYINSVPEAKAIFEQMKRG